MHRYRSLWQSGLLLLALSALAGCLMDGTLDDKGGGTLVIKYRLSSEAQFTSAKRRMQSAQVKLTDAKVDPDKWATFNLKFDDVTKLSSIEFFNHTVFTLSNDEGGTKTLSAKFTNPNPTRLPDEMIKYFGGEASITIHLPGTVVKSNAMKTEGNTVKWTYPFGDFTSAPEISVTVTYKPAAPPS